MASIIWFSFTSCALYGMDISHDAAADALHSRTQNFANLDLPSSMQMLPSYRALTYRHTAHTRFFAF